MKALVTGATGFIGKHLLARLERPHALVRDPLQLGIDHPDVQTWRWSASEVPPAAAFDAVDTIFHLAGESITQRWTAAAKGRFHASRVHGTANLLAALAACETRPRVLVAASAVGYYGDCGDRLLDEDSPVGSDYLAGLCQQWEAEALTARELGMRVVRVRFGVVLERDGGALGKMLLPFRLGLGAVLGSGRQWFPWIHMHDLVELLLYAAQHDDLAGPLNAVAPACVRNREFTRTLARVLGRPAFLRAPRFALRLGLGEMAEAVLASTRAAPRRAIDAGFEFRYPELENALAAIMANPVAKPTGSSASSA